MKKMTPLIWLGLALAVSFPTLAQKKEDPDPGITRRFDSTVLRLKKIKINDAREVQQVVKTTPETVPDPVSVPLSSLNSRIQSAQKELDGRMKALVSKHPLGQQIDKDLLPLLSGLPEPISALPQAKAEIKQSSDDNIYTRYIEKVKAYRAGLEEKARQELSANRKEAGQMEKEAYQNAKGAEEMLGSNPLIAEMGGIEKLKSMTPEQRAALAQQMAEKVKKDPSAYMARHTPVTKTSHEAAVANRDRASTSIAIEKRLAVIMDHAREMAGITGSLQQETDAYFDGLNKKIADVYGRRVAELPVINMGEAGRGKDTYPVDLAYNIVLYPVEKQQSVSNKEGWRHSLMALKVTIGEYNDLLSDYYSEDTMAGQLMKEKGLVPLRLAAGFAESLIRLAEMAKSLTSQNASWQRTFDEKVLRVYE